MTGAEVLAILFKATQAAVADYTAKKAKAGVEAVLDWIGRQSAGLSSTDRHALKQLITEEPSLIQKLLARLVWPKDRKGIMLVGATGAGKSHLAAALAQTTRQADNLSTVAITETSGFFNGRLVSLRDTPGKPEHGGELWKAIRKYEPSILVVMVAYGYLAPAGTGAELRIGMRHPLRRKLARYLEDGREEEIHNIRQLTDLCEVPKEKVKHVLVVVNKMDIWLSEHSGIVNYYQSDPAFQGAIQGLLAKFVRPGQTAQVVTAAADYNSFKGQAASPLFSKEAATDSVRVLKAFLASLLLDGKIT